MLLQEFFFNAYMLWPTNWIGEGHYQNILLQAYDTDIIDPWYLHSLGVQLGFLTILGFAFWLAVKRPILSLRDKAYMMAWGVYLLIQVWQVIHTANIGPIEYKVDLLMLASLIGCAEILVYAKRIAT